MVTFQKMSPEEFQVYLKNIIDSYAQDLANNYEIPLEMALERSKKETSEVLVEGVDTPGHLLYGIRLEGTSENVGALWVSVDDVKNEAFILDIEIVKTQRGKGLGREAMLLIEEQMRAQGVQKIGLHVFGDNPAALRLYESLGYEAFSIQMRKNLGEKPGR